MTTSMKPQAPETPLFMQRDRFDPKPALAGFRRDGEVPIVRSFVGDEAYLITRYEDVRAVLGDAERFSNTGRAGFRGPNAPEISEQEMAQMRAGNLLAQDPPDHNRLRRMLTPEFTQRRMKRLEPRISEIVTEHLDAMEKAGPPSDLVADFALPIPSLVICELLGVPYEDRAEFQQRSNRLLDMTKTQQERLAVSRESRAYMSTLVDRALADPGEDILGMLVREHGDDLTHDELTGIAGLLLIAGHETTSNMLGLGTLALLQNPEQIPVVRDNPEMARPAVEELLRYLSIVHTGVPRITTTDVEVRGTTIPKDSIVVCSLPAANRDPETLENPDLLDLSRGAAGHVAFGHGIHHCLGAPLARMEMETAFPALFRRFPNLALDGDIDDVAFRAFFFIYGLHSLRVTW